MKQIKKIQFVRRMLLAFIIILFLSGLTAIPVKAELFSSQTQLHYWLQKVLSAYKKVNDEYPFLLYGYDWLAFANFILAVLFIGPYRDPIKNIWIMEFGLISCVLIFPLAFIRGPFRGIPIGWQLIDCSFGLFGFISLWICYVKQKNTILLIHSLKNKS